MGREEEKNGENRERGSHLVYQIQGREKDGGRLLWIDEEKRKRWKRFSSIFIYFILYFIIIFIFFKSYGSKVLITMPPHHLSSQSLQLKLHITPTPLHFSPANPKFIYFFF